MGDNAMCQPAVRLQCCVDIAQSRPNHVHHHLGSSNSRKGVAKRDTSLRRAFFVSFVFLICGCIVVDMYSGALMPRFGVGSVFTWDELGTSNPLREIFERFSISDASQIAAAEDNNNILHTHKNTEGFGDAGITLSIIGFADSHAQLGIVSAHGVVREWERGGLPRNDNYVGLKAVDASDRDPMEANEKLVGPSFLCGNLLPQLNLSASQMTSPTYNFFNYNSMKQKVTGLKRNGFTAGPVDSATMILTDRAGYAALSREHPHILDGATAFVDVIIGLGYIGGSKALQLASKREVAHACGCSYDDLLLQPRTLATFTGEECSILDRLSMPPLKDTRMNGTGETTATTTQPSVWIVKPKYGEKGIGIRVVGAGDPLLRTIYERECIERRPFGNLIQQYILNPLLLDGCKFDIRAYFLIGSTDPFAVFYYRGYIRRAMTKFKLDDLSSDASHLTNTNIQEKKKGYEGDDHIWSFKQLQHYLDSNKLAPPSYVEQTLEPFIKGMAAFCFETARDNIVRRKGAFQLVGLDFMIDATLKIHFIEGNGRPGFGSQNEWKMAFGTTLATNMFRLVLRLQQNPVFASKLRLGDSTHGFEVIVSEYQEVCDGGVRFNPCAAFATAVHPGDGEPYRRWLLSSPPQ